MDAGSVWTRRLNSSIRVSAIVTVGYFGETAWLAVDFLPVSSVTVNTTL